MASHCWFARHFGSHYHIEQYTLVRTSAQYATVLVHGAEQRMAKRSEYQHYCETLEAAQQYLQEQLQRRVEAAQQQLERLRQQQDQPLPVRLVPDQRPQLPERLILD